MASQVGPPVVLRSGYFPALQRKHISPVHHTTPQLSRQQHQKGQDPRPPTKTIIAGALLISVFAYFLCFALIGLRRYRGVRAASDQNAALLKRLSKVFVTGVPRLNSSELQTACEDVSNIIETFSGCLMYKGILSIGVEIAVLSTSVRSSEQWSSYAEREFKRKVNGFSLKLFLPGLAVSIELSHKGTVILHQ